MMPRPFVTTASLSTGSSGEINPLRILFIFFTILQVVWAVVGLIAIN